ncbi:hypothetical protein J6590_074036 [Homalodisca vitripennis]|nr:hypothetical protein J6590_074036 [Homalodisca vitripennis]
MELLELCTQCNYFELEGKVYRQDEGVAMGSPLSPIFANIFAFSLVQTEDLVEGIDETKRPLNVRIEVTKKTPEKVSQKSQKLHTVVGPKTII